MAKGDPARMGSHTGEVTFSRWSLDRYDDRRHRRSCHVCGGRVVEAVVAYPVMRRTVVVCLTCAKALGDEVAGDVVTGRVPDGTPGVRDAANPCDLYRPGTPAGDCVSDGHYLCPGCVELDPEVTRGDG